MYKKINLLKMQSINPIRLFSFIMALVFFVSCQKDTDVNSMDLDAISQSQNLITICHAFGDGHFTKIKVKESDLSSHFEHGDKLPNECMDNGFFLNDYCRVIDVSIETEICDNEIDDNCNGLIDDDDSEYCVTCPCYTYEEVLASANIKYYNFEIIDCAGPFIGFTNDVCNYGINKVQGLAISLEGTTCLELSPAEISKCAEIIIKAQEKLQLPNFCNPFHENATEVNSFRSS